MDYLIHHLLDKSTCLNLAKDIKREKSEWEEGKKTAGSHASTVKNNFQLNRDSEISLKHSQFISEKITSDKLLKSFALPRKLHGLMFTRTGEGQGYGVHVDNPYMSSGRSDLSFTLFLSEPNDYQGGELSLQTIQGCKKLKLQSGHIVIYPSTSLHSVEPVTFGERLVCVGWIQSYVQNNEDRNILFGLDAGARGLLAKQGRTPELDLVFQAYSNLLRRLGD